MNSLGFPLYVNGSMTNDQFSMSHDPREPGSPVRMVVGTPPNARTSLLYEPMDVRHGASGLGKISPLFGAIGAIADSQDSVSSMTVPVTNRVAPGLAFAAVVGAAAVYVGLYGAAGWYAGKAMAPSASAERSYKWVGALSSVLFGSLGLGVLGGISLASKR
jgi:hypothetical protein